MEENTSLHTECAHKPRPAVLNQFSRTELLLGEDNMQRLFNARVAVLAVSADTLWKHWLVWALEHWI